MNIEKYIISGVIEMYVMGALAADEAEELKFLASHHPKIDAEIEQVSVNLESYASANAKMYPASSFPFGKSNMQYSI